MNKISSVVSTLFVIFGISFFALIIYVSILGENHKINFVVESYFTNIKSRNYIKACESISSDPMHEYLQDKEQCANFSFLLELSLLKQFKLLDKNDYSIKIIKQSFWIPFLSNDTVLISIAFTEKEKNFFQAFFNKSDSSELIHDLMVVERKKGTWEIKEIRLKESLLFGVFDELTNSVDLNKYIQSSDKGYTLNNNTIAPDTLSNIERRLLEFSMYKISDI